MPSPSVRPAPRPVRLLRRLTAGLTVGLTLATAGGVALAGSPVPSAAPVPLDERGGEDTGLVLVSADPHRWPGHPGRRLVTHTVRKGDTATGLAVRYHAWTDELRALNHLGRHGTLFVGERIRIPVVVAAARKAHAHRHTHRKAAHHKTTHRKPTHRTKAKHTRTAAHPWKLADASRAKVRRVVVRTARQHHVDPHLALAVAWQESGWQQRRISSAGAIGVMQVLPGTARWMGEYTGQDLNPYGLYDNVEAGVALLKVLHRQAGHRTAVASYFQGLGSVQERGMYRSTKTYVRSVTHLRERMERGWNPV